MLWVLVLIGGCLGGGVEDEPFFQVVSKRYTYKGTSLAQWQELEVLPVIHQLVSIGKERESFWAVTGNDLVLLTPNEQLELRATSYASELNVDIGPNTYIAVHSSIHDLAVAGPNSLWCCESVLEGGTCSRFAAPFSNVSDITWTEHGEGWVGGPQGAYAFVCPSGKITRVADIEEPVSAVASYATTNPSDTIFAAATPMNVWRMGPMPGPFPAPGMKSQKLFNTYGIHREWNAGICDSPVRSLSFDANGGLWIASADAVIWQRPDWTYFRLDFAQGVPQNDTLVVNARGALSPKEGAPGQGRVWFATTRGVVRLDVASMEWSYHAGPRWIPGQVAFALAIDGNAQSAGGVGAWVADEKGMAYLYPLKQTLREKAAHYQAMIEARHDRFGLTADVSLARWGDLSSFVQQSSDNDGLWTSMYLTSQIFRVASARNEEEKKVAKLAVWKSFEGLELLNHVTGIQGFMARSVLKYGVPHPGGVWYNSTAMPEWQFKGDTSSDEVCGHLLVYPLFHDLVCETDEERARPLTLLQDITAGIVKNGFQLIGPTGQATTWGRWDIDSLMNTFKYYDERGLNSLQILSWLASAHRLTNDSMFVDAYKYLVDAGYAYNTINHLINVPDDRNYSDDELAFLPLLLAMYTLSPSDPAAEPFVLALNRQWRAVEGEKAALWNLVKGYAQQRGFESPLSYDQEAVRWCLRRWPMELIDWEFDNSHRLDMQLNPYGDREGVENNDSVDLFPPDERQASRYNENPFVLRGGSGMSETDPGVFLLPFWFGVWSGLL